MIGKLIMTPRLLVCLLLPPLLWAANAVIGRYAAQLIAPMLLNFLRWGVALVFLFLLTGSNRLRWQQLYPNRYWFIWASLFGIGLYNSLQYLALHTSSATNVTLMAASMPLWMMLNGWLFFKQNCSRQQFLAAALSILGVLIILTRADIRGLQALKINFGDLYMLLAACCWSWYSWMLTRAPRYEGSSAMVFLLAQLNFGLIWAASLAYTEYALHLSYLNWSWQVLATVIFVALGPSLLAYRCWGVAVTEVGPTMAAIFANFTPLFAALFSSILLGEALQAYQVMAFACMLAAVFSSARGRANRSREKTLN